MFKKLAYFTDIHWGRSSNSQVALEDNKAFTEWFISEAKRRECETFIFGGDFFDNRHQVHVQTMSMALDSLDLLNDAFPQSFFVIGNHDLFHRDKREVTSTELARNLPNITLIRDPLTIGEVTFLPWLVNNEHKTLKLPKSKYVFAHLEVPGFLMNAKVEMPDSSHAVKGDQFADHEAVFTGHFHMRQQKGNIIYTGNVMPFSFSDNWDGERGAMFMDWDGKPEFVAWPDQPLFRTMKLSDLLNEPEKYLKPKLTARVTIDIDISYEESQVIKDAMIETYGLRKIELVNQAKGAESEDSFIDGVTFQSVDQIVIDGLMSVQSQDLKPEILVDLYRALGNH